MIKGLSTFAILSLGAFLFLAACNCGLDNDDDDIFYVAFGASAATGAGAAPPTEGYVFLIEEKLDDETEESADLFMNKRLTYFYIS